LEKRGAGGGEGNGNAAALNWKDKVAAVKIKKDTFNHGSDRVHLLGVVKRAEFLPQVKEALVEF